MPKVEFLAVVSCATILLYLGFILAELGFSCYGPTPIYEDSVSTIMVVNLQVPIPTEGVQHIYVQYFAIQDLKE